MGSIVKKNIVREVSFNLGVDQDDVSYVYDEIFKVIRNQISKKFNVSIRGFGSFTIINKPSRKYSFMGELIDTKEKNLVKFEPSKFIKREINNFCS